MTPFEQLLNAWLTEQRPPPPIVTLLGFELVSYGQGRGVVRFEAETRHHNALGTLHGGVLCDLADVAMGVALASTLEAGEGFTTLELSTAFLKSVKRGQLTATGEVVRRGRRTAYLECEIVDEAGQLVAKTTSTCLVGGI